MRLLLYTSENGTCGTLLSHTDPSAHPQFNFSRPTTFLIHGYRPTGSAPTWLSSITKLLLARTDMNLIIVDWNYGAANLIYHIAAQNTHIVAENLTAFVERLKVCVCKEFLRATIHSLCWDSQYQTLLFGFFFQEKGLSLSSIHMIGVSLGAHISGFVGANMNGSIGRITGKSRSQISETQSCLRSLLSKEGDCCHLLKQSNE